MPNVEAHITGIIYKIECKVGQKVDEGDTVLVLESMKMEMPVMWASTLGKASSCGRDRSREETISFGTDASAARLGGPGRGGSAATRAIGVGSSE